jgi:uncharacterized membrane protein YfcA
MQDQLCILRHTQNVNIVSFVEISLIMFVATTFRTAFGFGEALIAVPLLSLVWPVRLSAPLAVLASVVIATVAIIKDWRHIHFSNAKKLLFSTVFGLPFGLLLLRYAPEGQIKAFLGALLFFFSLFSLFSPEFFVLPNDRFIWLFGFLAGITGGSYGMNGPPLAIYGAARNWTPHQFRATIQAYFLPASFLGLIGYFASGIWTSETTALFGYSLPAITAGIFAGRFVNRRLHPKKFVRLLYGGLLLVACILLIQSYSELSVSN